MIRFGVIGTGWITESMIAGAMQYPELLQLTAVCSRTRERGEAFARLYGQDVAVFTDPAEMAMSDALDMVYIASPNSCHMAQSRLFLENGKHVLCEKPLSADPDEVARVQRLAAERGLLFREAIMMLYQPQLSVLEDAIRQCGHITTAHFQFYQLSSKYEALCRGETPNIFNPALHTGTLMDLGVYCVYPALYFFGEPDTVAAGAHFLPTGADGNGSALFTYPDKQVILSYSKIGQGYAPSEIVGDAGTVTIGSISKLNDIRLHLYGQPERVLWGETEKAELMGHEIAAFARDIEAGETMGGAADTLALAVSRRLAEIRRCAGIVFPGENEVRK